MRKTAEQLRTNDWIWWPLNGNWMRVVQRPQPEAIHRHGSGLLALVLQDKGGYPVTASVSPDHEYEVRDA